jgi:uncharacterized DUF497 family protein
MQREMLKNIAYHLKELRACSNDPGAISIFDEAHSDKEERWITLGRDRTGSLIVVSHTFQQHLPLSVRIRIISARKATKKEKNIYVAWKQ